MKSITVLKATLAASIALTALMALGGCSWGRDDRDHHDDRDHDSDHHDDGHQDDHHDDHPDAH